MDAQLLPLVAAVAAFILWHVIMAGDRVRGALVGRLGATRFAGLFSAGALITLALAILAYGHAPYSELWDAPTWVRHISLSVMPAACILIIAGASTANPSTVGMGGPEAGSVKVVGILTITRHPLMWGIGLFGLVHMLANGDVASQILFGGISVLALLGTLRLDAKKRRVMGRKWEEFESRTSNLPFAAVTAKRVALDLAGIGWPRVLGGLALYAVMLFIHGEAFGTVPWRI